MLCVVMCDRWVDDQRFRPNRLFELRLAHRGPRRIPLGIGDVSHGVMILVLQQEERREKLTRPGDWQEEICCFKTRGTPIRPYQLSPTAAI